MNPQKAYVIHRHAYRESSYLLTMFCEQAGIVRAIARGTRKKKYNAISEPFCELQVSWYGRNELKTLQRWETTTPCPQLDVTKLICMQYVNELLYRLLQSWDPHPLLYASYHNLLQRITTSPHYPTELRRFELLLLQELGYRFNWIDCQSNSSLEDKKRYKYIAGLGFVMDPNGVLFGYDLLAISRDDWQQESTQQAAKMITRARLNEVLGNRQLNSRNIMQQLLSN